ncbi:cytochrome P450 2G1-like isoform X2 [Pseudophryne corroboree]|uniref:cytochrome P450 2G1-like isoform X2 n=1 Tax=Pseudophryne corroboree TaxID=495146 RepID=UPI003081FDD2
MDLPQDFALLLVICASCLFLYLRLKRFWTCQNFPPGPTPLPLLGNILEIKLGGMVNSVMKLREKYGDVFVIYLGSRPIVIVTGYKLVKEIYLDSGDDFINRGIIPCWQPFYKDHGLVFTRNVERWRELRRFSMSILRDFGFGKRSAEERIQEEASWLVEELKKTQESFFDPWHCVSKAIGNIIFSIMFGNHHEYEDKDMDNVLSYINETFLIICSSWGQMYDTLPWLMRYIPGRHHKIKHLLKKLSHFVETRVQINLKTLDPNNPRDYVDAFLIKLDKEKANPDSEFNMKNLLACTLQIFFAGVDTVNTTLIYSLLILLKYPDVLAKVHDEIDHVIGRLRSPTVQDRNNMPYTEAVIHEMQRFTELAPLGFPRATTKEVKINGYTLPKERETASESP